MEQNIKKNHIDEKEIEKEMTTTVECRACRVYVEIFGGQLFDSATGEIQVSPDVDQFDTYDTQRIVSISHDDPSIPAIVFRIVTSARTACLIEPVNY